MACGLQMPPSMVLGPFLEDAPTDVEPQLEPETETFPGLQRRSSPELDFLETLGPEEDDEDLELVTPTTATRRLGGLGSYRLIRCIAVGGMGVVWEADHVHLHRRAAIKRVRDDLAAHPALLGRFLAEASAVARIQHPGVVQVYDYGLDDRRTPYLAMELVEGESLAARLEAAGSLPADQVIDIGRQIAEAMSAAHATGVVHRDLKPAHVHLVRDPAGGERIKLLDFGVAKALGVSDELDRTRTGCVLGTPAYMSPEQAAGHRTVDPRCDVYSLGCVLYHLACGEPPFSGEISEVMAGHRYAVPSPPSSLGVSLPVGLEALLLRMLAKEATERPAMRVVAGELAALKRREAVTAPPPPAPPEPERSGSSALAFSFAAGLAAGVALLCALLALL